jgi:cytochrome c oxidase assembly protein subunit 15
MAYKNEKTDKNSLIRASFVVLAIELFSGVTLAYFDLPALAQVMHLLFATLILGMLWHLWLKSSARIV